LNFEDFISFCLEKGLKTVPIVINNFALPDTVDNLLKRAEGLSVLNPTCEREGIVVRPKIETQYKGSRLSFKAISNKYLLNHEE
jgi:hypothetical protein